MSAEPVGLGTNLESNLLKNSFKGYKYCCMHRSLRVYCLTSLSHLQISCSYSSLCVVVTHKDIIEWLAFVFFFFFPFGWQKETC